MDVEGEAVKRVPVEAVAVFLIVLALVLWARMGPTVAAQDAVHETSRWSTVSWQFTDIGKVVVLRDDASETCWAVAPGAMVLGDVPCE